MSVVSLEQVRPAPLFGPQGEPSGEETSPTLEDAARKERGYVRERLKEELGRDPSEEEVDEWLRKHTEGY